MSFNPTVPSAPPRWPCQAISQTLTLGGMVEWSPPDQYVFVMTDAAATVPAGDAGTPITLSRADTTTIIQEWLTTTESQTFHWTGEQAISWGDTLVAEIFAETEVAFSVFGWLSLAVYIG